MQAMFTRLPAPVVGQFVRSGMGTRLWFVVAVLPLPHGPAGLHLPGTHVCAVLPAGHVKAGVWVPPGNTQCNAYGSRSAKWLAVGCGAHHPVQPGPACPPMPQQVAHYLQNLHT